jgi:energy-coupling factor transporter ATP-binding protein EcfA2
VIIRRVHLRRFRKFADQVLECGPGLNVIRGRNDAGKSTLHLAFSAVLFPVKPTDAQSYGRWGEERPGEITMEFDADGRTYQLHKDFRLRKVRLQCGERTWETPKEVEREIGEVLGLPSAGLFRATAHIGQWELARVQEEREEIGTRLARIITGGDSDANRVVDTLDKYIRRMEVGLHHPARNAGPLKRDSDRIAFLISEQQRLAGEVAAIEQAAAQHGRLAADIADLERRAGDDAALLDANRRLHTLDGDVADLSRRAEHLRGLVDRIESASRDLAAAEAGPEAAPPPLDPEALLRLQEADLRVRVLRRSIETPGAAGPDAGAGDARSAETRIALGVLALGALFSALLGAVLLGTHRTPWGMGALLFAAMLLALAGAVVGGRTVLEMRIRTGRLRDREAQAAQRRRELEEAAEEVRRLLSLLGVPSLERALERQQRCREAAHTRDTARGVLEGLLGGRTRESVVEEYQRALLDLAAARAQREDPDLALRRLDAAAVQRLQTEAEARKKELAAAQGELQRLEGRLSGRSPHDDLARVEEELEETRARCARAQRQVEVLKLTREVLAEAYRHTIVPGRVKLEELAGGYLRALSGGAYDRLSVDEHTLAPRVWVGPPKEWADVEAREIGSGAVDQCYLALRLGLVDLLCRGRRPPLFLDDPFLAYDEERQEAAMSLLATLSRERQIFLFTCRAVYDARADHLLLLGDVRASAAAP